MKIMMNFQGKRNPKQIQITENKITENKKTKQFWSFINFNFGSVPILRSRILDLVGISKFVLRVSDLPQGFTLIELLISVLIITVLLSVSLAGYARLNQRQTLLSAGQNLKNIIRDAQSRVVNNEIDCNFCDCSTSGATLSNGWTVDFSTNQIYGSCGLTPTPFSKKPFNLSANTVITPYVTPASQLVFKSNPFSVSSKATICVSKSNIPSNFYVIRVNESGSISDDGGIVGACPTPLP